MDSRANTPSSCYSWTSVPPSQASANHSSSQPSVSPLTRIVAGAVGGGVLLVGLLFFGIWHYRKRRQVPPSHIEPLVPEASSIESGMETRRKCQTELLSAEIRYPPSLSAPSSMSLPDSLQSQASQNATQSSTSHSNLADDELQLMKDLYLSKVPLPTIAQVVWCIHDLKTRALASEATSDKAQSEGDVDVAINLLEDARRHLLQSAQTGDLRGRTSSMSTVAAWISPTEERQPSRQRNGSVATQVSIPPSYTTDPRS